MTREPRAVTLTDRLLAEALRLREEALGHPPATPDADARAIRAGGDFLQRIHVRARSLPEAGVVLRRLARLRASARLLIVVLLVLALLTGSAVAAAALAAESPASLPLVLVSVVGINLLSLLLWLLSLPLSRRIAPGIGRGLRSLWLRLAGRTDIVTTDPVAGLLHLIGGGTVGRWLAASLVHAAWLAFAFAGLLTLALLLSLRAYALSWETTLLSPESLQAWAQALSWGPSLLGAPGAGELPLYPGGDSIAHRGWSQWLLAAVLTYGVAPRAIALFLSLLLLWRAQHALGRDLQRPGYARLRARLLPDHRSLGVVDAAPALPHSDTVALLPAPKLSGAVHALWLEGRETDAAPPLAGVRWIWLGAVDDAESRGLALQRLRDAAPATLAILARATTTPDRGIERYSAELTQAARAQTVLLLCEFERLQARGAAPCAQRLADWQALAQRAGAAGVLTAATPTGVAA